MASFYLVDSVDLFLNDSNEQVLAALALEYAKRGYTSQYTDQTLTWQRDLLHLKAVLGECARCSKDVSKWSLLLEFCIPRKEARIDAVLLIHSTIILLELKANAPSSASLRQAEEYALLLHYFHKASGDRKIIPLVIAPATDRTAVLKQRQAELFAQLPGYWIAPAAYVSWEDLASILLDVPQDGSFQLKASDWNASSYRPVPTILEAATALRTGLSIREIAHSEAAEHEIADVVSTLQAIVYEPKATRRHLVCFLTGVPGSGKTLVGLSLAHSEQSQVDPVHFMSGNGPLVQVLQHLFAQQSRSEGKSALQAKQKRKR